MALDYPLHGQRKCSCIAVASHHEGQWPTIAAAVNFRPRPSLACTMTVHARSPESRPSAQASQSASRGSAADESGPSAEIGETTIPSCQ